MMSSADARVVSGKTNSQDNSLREKLVNVRRTAKVVTGGRIFGFSAIVVVGDGNGRIGVGQGKSREVPQAIQKATEAGKRNMRRVELNKSTIQHRVEGNYGATKIIMLPAVEGTGVIAGGAMRSLCEVIGIKDVVAKCIGSRSPVNVVKATLDALMQMVTPEMVAAKRGMTVQDLFE
jgi:small subunit ribosomal protein S5